MFILLLSAAIAPGLALLSYFYLRNQMDTEPRRTLLNSFIFGAIITFPILFIQFILKEEQTFSSVFFSNVIFTSIIEEFFKWLVIFAAILRNVEFDDPYDGVLYGVAVSLGFATVENVIYLISFGIDQAFMRAILPVSSHALFGVVMGYYYGKGKFSADHQKKIIFLALIAPVVLHITYNSILMMEEYFMYVMLPFMFFLWWFALRKVKQAHEHLVEHLSRINGPMS
ncbi:PrsW family intramembrane metalloprotease [Solibacillus sp. R5-41]|uniref:glutamic-type intramembrane protease PrsW n=1 Tax=Solibacillus sp. R5-41 TaxID=2048654 RepID=UPI000C128069|nr:glutamic-type intramembrane protease PrsW [Solibacillus sp. R5-41]ATP39607.1 PrsW family intramembrane metalloprotease [Solibacillus sp. R5-41]